MPQIGVMSKRNGKPDTRFTQPMILTSKEKPDRRFNANSRVGQNRINPLEAYRQAQSTRASKKNEASNQI